MARLLLLAAGFGLTATTLLAQVPGSLEGVFTVGVATPTGAWADQTHGSIQVGLGGRYDFGGIALGAEVLLVQGHSKEHLPTTEAGDLSTAGLVPQLYVPLYSKGDWELFGMGGFGIAKVWATSGYRTDFVPTPEGSHADTYGGTTSWSTTRPMAMAGLGLIRGNHAGKRIGLEVRWQQVATPGIRATTLSTCLLVAW